MSEKTPIPSREERQQCHLARDAYLACLDKSGIDDPSKAGAACDGLRQKVFGTCPESWATYFLQLRAMQKKKERDMEQTAKRLGH
ncbi:hypothetical protein GGI02_003719 [Coemansia sp. RSA 2322]|uniref:Cytochrome c oxidase assembly factor 6 homolog n=1 Tax=Coemansia thaxteri TaxID=2663907 RepID=A0A9W8BLQ5_9FUNG|nr:hypothetical protein H4R26_002053 [Coemansia thaxteri]KAJ2468370.1 hypothetical protein GGI02_003719 [Coemansia sp. RSA 2322]KAJ2486800.1 hypothetical protein EV174_000904 [Coemansia sp. RSA 2320]